MRRLIAVFAAVMFLGAFGVVLANDSSDPPKSSSKSGEGKDWKKDKKKWSKKDRQDWKKGKWSEKERKEWMKGKENWTKEDWDKWKKDKDKE